MQITKHQYDGQGEKVFAVSSHSFLLFHQKTPVASHALY